MGARKPAFALSTRPVRAAPRAYVAGRTTPLEEAPQRNCRAASKTPPTTSPPLH